MIWTRDSSAQSSWTTFATSGRARQVRNRHYAMTRRHATIPLMIGVPVRLHAPDGDDVGVAHIPVPIEPGDLIATVDGTFRIIDVVSSPPGSLFAVAFASADVRRN